jgi:hypothetical protein
MQTNPLRLFEGMTNQFSQAMVMIQREINVMEPHMLVKKASWRMQTLRYIRSCSTITGRVLETATQVHLRSMDRIAAALRPRNLRWLADEPAFADRYQMGERQADVMIRGDREEKRRKNLVWFLKNNTSIIRNESPSQQRHQS